MTRLATLAVHRSTHSGSSLKDQIAACDLYSNIHFGVTPSVFVDDGMHGESQPGYRSLIEFCDVKEGTIVLIKNARVLHRMAQSELAEVRTSLARSGAWLRDLDGMEYFQDDDIVRVLKARALR